MFESLLAWFASQQFESELLQSVQQRVICWTTLTFGRKSKVRQEVTITCWTSDSKSARRRVLVHAHVWTSIDAEWRGHRWIRHMNYNYTSRLLLLDKAAKWVQEILNASSAGVSWAYDDTASLEELTKGELCEGPLYIYRGA